MNLCFDELKCPNCATQTMGSAGGSFGGRVCHTQKICSTCKLGLLIIPMKKEYEYTVTATTEEERIEKRIQKAKEEAELELAKTITRIKETGY